MKRLLSIIALLLSTVIVLSSCNGGSTDTSMENTADGLVLIENGEVNAKLIYPSGDSELREACRDIASAAKEVFGLTIPVGSDNSTPYDRNSVEILVGDTNRPECAEAKAKIHKVSDYLCLRSGNKLVITGLSKLCTKNAVNYFISNFIRSATEAADLVFKPEDDYILYNTYAVTVDTCAGIPLYEYRIVYPADSHKGEYYTALNLCYHLYANVGILIPVIADSEDTQANGKEILVGKTNRNKSADCTEGQFSVSVNGNNLCIGANDLFGFVAAEEYLIKTLFTRMSDDNVLSSGFSYTAKADAMPEKAGDYRVIFNNLWGLEEVANRDDYALDFYLAYQPDVIALNEYWDNYRNQAVIADELEKQGYIEIIPKAQTEIKGNNGNPANNVLPVFYDPTALKVVESTYVHYTWYSDDTTEDPTARADDSKGITLVVFEGLDGNGEGNGERFIILNTHLTSNYISKTHGYNSRLLNVDQLWETAQPYIEKYPDASIISGCDFNANLKSDEIKKLMKLGFEPCHDIAQIADDQTSHHGYPIYNAELGFYTGAASFSEKSKYENSIDHIFRYGSTVEPKLFDTLLCRYTAFFTDHSPLMLDFNVITEQ